MKINTFIAMLLLLPAIVFVQYEFKPIVDTSAIHCAHVENPIDPMPNPHYNYTKKIQGLYHIVEQMPQPKITKEKIESLLENNIRMNKQEKTLNGTMYFQCIVSCKGKAGDFQTIYCPESMTNICSQTITLLKDQLDNWTPGKQQNKNVDVLVKIWVKINKSEITVRAPLY